jgi:hypothetical protein
MGLASSISKISSFIGKASSTVTSITKGTGTGTNIPTNSVMKALGMGDSLGFGSIAEIKNSIENIAGGIATGINLIKCAWDLLSIDTALAFLEQLAMGVVGAVTAVIDQVVGAVVGQVTAAISSVIGAVLGVINAIKNMINSILLIVDALIDLWENWTNWGDLKWQLDIESQSCEDMFSSIAGCLLNQLLGNKFDKLLGKITGFGDKITGKINDFGGRINSAIYEEMQDVNTFTSFAN